MLGEQSVVRYESRYVIVHNDGEDNQEEDDAYLNDSLFHRQAEIPSQDAFDPQ